MDEREVVIRIRNVSKQYWLGVIGKSTLQHELQSWWAKCRGREDPNARIGLSHRKTGETFLALDGVSLDVYRGERIGVIGANGAGKSTLFKLLSRVTAPTEGAIGVKGRISSMLEVGTGFHAELSGRENIYLNGAILGMKKSEVEEKIDDIIEFSECAEFMDTPVKRYSSGMYVKLAFAVAAHLNSEILLMDEVLAVGDMKFQKKCLDKMAALSKDEKKTILYVSHNMETIRSLCSRCIVLEQGRILFDGGPEEAIALYLGSVIQMKQHYTFSHPVDVKKVTGKIRLLELDVPDSAMVAAKDGLVFRVRFQALERIGDLHIRLTIYSRELQVIGTSISGHAGRFEKGQYGYAVLKFDTRTLAEGAYTAQLAAVEPMGEGKQVRHDQVDHAFAFEVTEDAFDQYQIHWSVKNWGHVVYPDLEVEEHGISAERL